MVIIFNSLIATVVMFAAVSFVAHLLGWDQED
nr:MAG TPA: light-harvesting protein-like protein [Caudoviricetes sp.]